MMTRKNSPETIVENCQPCKSIGGRLAVGRAVHLRSPQNPRTCKFRFPGATRTPIGSPKPQQHQFHRSLSAPRPNHQPASGRHLGAFLHIGHAVNATAVPAVSPNERQPLQNLSPHPPTYVSSIRRQPEDIDTTTHYHHAGILRLPADSVSQ